MIRLFLLGKKGLLALRNLKDEYLDQISTVVVGTDSKIQNDYSNDIFELAKNRGVKAIFRKDFKEQESVALNIAIGWRWIIDSNARLVVFHDSLLPKYRGFNPLVTALINGDNEVGVTAIEGVAEYDKGGILAQKKIAISYPLKIERAIELISEQYAVLLNDILQNYLQNNLVPVPQDESEATYSLWRDEKDYEIDWSLSAHEIIRFINAVSFPYNGAKTYVNDKVVRIFSAEYAGDVEISNRTPGKVIFKDGESFTIVCGKGLICVNQFFDAEGKLIDLKNKFRIRFT